MRRLKVYTASKLPRAKLWRTFREDPEWEFVHFTASWIDDPHIDTEMASGHAAVDPKIMEENWIKNQDDVEKSDSLLVYAGGDTLRGALVEVGIALACGIPVLAVGIDSDSTWTFHPMVVRVQTLKEAREKLQAAWRAINASN